MPGFDGTGPMGQGPVPGSSRSSYGRGRGRGFRNCFYATGLTGWMRRQRGMQAFGRFARAVSEGK